MKTNSEIKVNGYKALVKELGEVDAEKFISLIQSEPFNYTQWQKELWKDKGIEEISSAAMKFRKSKIEKQKKIKKGA